MTNAEKITANLDRLKQEAADPFYSAKHAVCFMINDHGPYDGWFIRHTSSGYDNVAVTDEVRQQIAALEHSPAPKFDEAAREKLLSLPIREDGLIALEHLVTKVLPASRPRGRPAGPTKEQIALRVDHDVLEAYRASGAGWQARMNQHLRDAIGL